MKLQSNFDDSKSLFLACEKWGIMEDTLSVFRQRMYDLSVNDPWDLLVWASERKDRHMAKAAIDKMTPDTFAAGRRRYYGHAFWKSLDDLSPSWQWRLLRAALDQPSQAAVDRLPWHEVGKMFEERSDEHFDPEQEYSAEETPAEDDKHSQSEWSEV
ncbi:uncharacterized protein L201_000797 [Kwoniella dendrophila CBS 6074]|uniref:Uncharacterized protein n=1 Tax=Kwoniella dendrophila CBS 6074 TaxID=1295534 RepID=A0AAX4JKJ3_9TREE